jgi:5-methylcytosine-specific restriction endonuclease McrBC regulatory subunit McrC
MSNYALRIPDSLFEYAKRCAEEENLSMNQFFVMAIAEKVSALQTAEFFREQAERADPNRAREILRKVPDRPAGKEDEIEEHVEEPRAMYSIRRKTSVKATKRKKPKSG